MKRRVQLTGGATFIVSLPKKWATQKGLEKGSEVEVEELGNSLLLSPCLPPEKEEVEISPQGNPEALARKVVALYLVGYNTIRVRSEERIPAPLREFLKQFVRSKLAGAEVIEDLPSTLTLKVLLSPTELSVKDAVRRMRLVTRTMLQDALTCVKEVNRTLAQDVVNRDDEVDRFGIYVIRLLKSAARRGGLIRKIGLEDLRDCLGYRLVVKSIERVADHAALVAKNTLHLTNQPLPSLLEKMEALANFSLSFFERAMDALEGENYETAERVIEEEEKIEPLITAAIEAILERPPQEIGPLRIMVESFRRVAEYSTDIAEVVLNLTVVKTIG
jgi:phosphate uptake regulator